MGHSELIHRACKQNWLFAATGFSLILMPLQYIFLAVPALNRKAETRSTDLNVGPAANSLGGQKTEDAGTVGDELPTAVSLFADEAVADAGIAMARGAAFGDDRLGAAIPIDVAHFLDRSRRVAGR